MDFEKYLELMKSEKDNEEISQIIDMNLKEILEIKKIHAAQRFIENFKEIINQEMLPLVNLEIINKEMGLYLYHWAQGEPQEWAIEIKNSDKAENNVSSRRKIERKIVKELNNFFKADDREEIYRFNNSVLKLDITNLDEKAIFNYLVGKDLAIKLEYKKLNFCIPDSANEINPKNKI